MPEDIGELKDRMSRLKDMLAEADIGGIQYVMKKNVDTVDMITSISDTAKLMTERNSRSIIVTDKGRPVGIVTDKDLVKRVVIDKIDPLSGVSRIMSTPLIALKKNESVSAATRLMIEKKIHNLPVLDGDKLIGMITPKCLLNISPKAVEIRNIDEILKNL